MEEQLDTLERDLLDPGRFARITGKLMAIVLLVVVALVFTRISCVYLNRITNDMVLDQRYFKETWQEIQVYDTELAKVKAELERYRELEHKRRANVGWIMDDNEELEIRGLEDIIRHAENERDRLVASRQKAAIDYNKNSDLVEPKVLIGLPEKIR